MLSLYDVKSGLFESAVHIDHVYLQNNPDIDKTYLKVLNKAFESCPTLLEFRDDHGNSIVHRTCELFIEHPVPLLLLQNMVDLVPIQLLLCKNSDGLSAADIAAAYSTVQVVNIILCRIGLYHPLINPFCFLKSFYQRGNLYQVIEKMSFFLERDKSILRMRSPHNHHTILHQCLSIEDRDALLSEKLFVIPLFIVHMDPRSCQDIRRHSTYTATMGNRYLGEDDRLPILILMQRKDFVIDFSQPSWTTSSKFYGLFRSILNAYPPAASKKCWSEQKSLASMFSSVHDRFYRSPYEYALHHHFPEEYLRLLLNACPEIDNRMMRLFNYKARKLALMIGFNSMSSNMIPNVLFLIRMLHLHLFKKVVLYL